VKPLAYPLLADENIHAEVVRKLIAAGRDIRTVHDEHLVGASDAAILQRSYEQGRVSLTHDADFARLAIQRGQAFIGIIYLRPGHIAPAFVLDALAALDAADIEVVPPFVIVLDRRGDHVRVRLRALP